MTIIKIDCDENAYDAEILQGAVKMCSSNCFSSEMSKKRFLWSPGRDSNPRPTALLPELQGRCSNR